MRNQLSFHLFFAAPLLVAASAITIGCGDDEDDGGAGGGGSDGGTSSSSTTTSSATSTASGGTASSTSSSSGGLDLTPPDAGIDGCVALFVDDDGVCRPSLDKCPAGSVPDIDAGCVAVGIVDCDPGFVDDRGLCLPRVDDCDDGLYPVPTEGCVSIDGPDGCGEGTWGNLEQGPDDLYVDAAYEGDDADGSLDRPFTTLADALAAAPDYRRIVLAAGTYTGAAIDHEVDIIGVCASRVSVETAADTNATFVLDPGAGESMVVAGLTVDDVTPGIVVLSGHVELSEVVVRHAGRKAILAEGATASMMIDHTLVTDTTESGTIGIGVQANLDATIRVTRSAMIRTITHGLQAVGGGSLTAEDVFVGGTVLDGSGYYGGVAAAADGVLTLRRVAGTDNATGVSAFYADGTATIEDCVFGSTTSDDFGTGLGVYEGAALTATRTAVVDAAAWGIDVFDSSMTGDHLLVADIADGPYGGIGINAEAMDLAHSAIVRTAGAGVSTAGPVTLVGVVVEDVEISSALGTGCGILNGDGAPIAIERSFVRGFTDFGIHSAVAGGSLGSLAVRRTLIAEGNGDGGTWGVGIGASARNMPLTIEDTRIEDVLGAGILTSTATTVLRTRIDGVAPAQVGRVTYPPSAPHVGPLADGVVLIGGTDTLTLEDVWVEDAARAGVMLSTGDHDLTRVRALGGEVGLALRDGASAKRFDSDFSGNALELEDPSPLVVPAAP